VGIAKSKTSALVLGTTGVGIVGIGSQIQNLGVTCTSLGASSSFVRELSKCLAKDDAQGRRELLGTSFTLQLIVNVPVVILALLFIRPLARFTFGNPEDYGFLLPILVTVPLQAIMSAHLTSVFYAHGKLQYLARASVIAAVSEAVAFISLVRFFGVAGAFWGITIGMAVWFSILAWFATRLESVRDLFHINLTRRYLKELVNTGAIMTIAGAVTYLTNAMIRIKITQSLGGSFAGIYQVVVALTAYYIPYFTNGVWGRLFPKVSAGGLCAESKYEWSEAMILTSILAGGVQIVLMVIVGPLVSAFYSRDFGSAVPLAPLQFIGDLFYLVSVPCVGVIVGLNRMYLYVVIWLVYYGLFYGLAALLMERLGLQGVIIAYVSSNLALVGFSVAYFLRKCRGSRHLWPTLASFGASTAAVMAQAALCLHDTPLALKLLLPGLWGLVGAAVLLSPGAKKFLLIHGYEPAPAPIREGIA
jgi:O-antigen/teichoic acid export membrane protein